MIACCIMGLLIIRNVYVKDYTKETKSFLTSTSSRIIGSTFKTLAILCLTDVGNQVSIPASISSTNFKEILASTDNSSICILLAFHRACGRAGHGRSDRGRDLKEMR